MPAAKKKKQYEDRNFNLTEDEMQDLITQAKDGSDYAQNRLLEVFANFLSKYTTLLFHGKFALKDYDIRRFIGLFVKDRTVRQFLMRNKLNANGIRHVNECIRGIQYMTQRYGDEEDVQQTVQLAFLHCVSVYTRREKIPFSGFLYSYYFYVLKKLVDAMLIDQLGRKTFPLLDDETFGEDFDGDDRPQGFTAPPDPGVDELLFAEKIDEYWVVGESTSHPFDILTVQERQLLRWRYVDRERTSDIATRITEHPNTVREHMHRIRKKLREAIDQDLQGL